MNRQHNPDVNYIHYKRENYEYTIGNDKVLIRSPDGKASLFDKHHVKGESRPNLLKRLLRIGQRNIKITHVDVEKFINRHF